MLDFDAPKLDKLELFETRPLAPQCLDRIADCLHGPTCVSVTYGLDGFEFECDLESHGFANVQV